MKAGRRLTGEVRGCRRVKAVEAIFETRPFGLVGQSVPNDVCLIILRNEVENE